MKNYGSDYSGNFAHIVMYLEVILFISGTFYPNGCSQFDNPEAPDFVKMAFASSFV